MECYYLGSFPPGYGGVTIKNQNLYIALSQCISLGKVDFNLIKRGNLYELLKFVIVLFAPHKHFVIGVSGKKTRKRLTQVLYYLNRRAMRKSIIMIMGGTAANDIVADPEYKKCALQYGQIYVETAGMVKTLAENGFLNVSLYPNGRFMPKQPVTVGRSEGTMKCVFFSLIQEEKGVDIILQAASKLPSIDFSFYGSIFPAYLDEFTSKIKNLHNVTYHGIFRGGNEEVYRELRKYDVLLFPTKWKIEGVPGVLVEAKIAGITAIVSNESYNAELVQDKQEGIVLELNDSEHLVAAINLLEHNRDYLFQLKQGNLKSSERFYIENYIEEILDQVR